MVNLFNKGGYIIDIYLSILTPVSMYVRGRVVRERDHVPRGSDGHLKALFNTLLRFNTSSLKQARLTLSSGNQQLESSTDDEGFFVFQDSYHRWSQNKEFTITLVDERHRAESSGVLRSTETIDGVGVVTDIDDTILHTGVSSFLKLRLLYNSLFINPFNRSSVDGAAAFLSKIDTDGPYFYVSNSPWNIYDYLQSFLDFNDFPEGSMILRDIDLGSAKTENHENGNKYQEIRRVLSMHPHYKFYLLGDAAEKDIDIYLSLDKEFSDQIKKIFIRLTGKLKKDSRIQKLAAEHDHVRTFRAFEELIPEFISR